MAVEYRLRVGLRLTDLWVPAARDVRLHLRHLAGVVSPSFLLVHGIGSNQGSGRSRRSPSQSCSPGLCRRPARPR